MNPKSSEVITLHTEELADGKLSYFLTQQQLEDGEDQGGTTYGIRVCCSLFGKQEYAELADITPNLAYAQELYELVRLYMVTPISLAEVAQDFITEKYSQ